MCGRADRYEVAQSDGPIDGADIAAAQPVGAAPDPAEPGTDQAVLLPAPVKRYVALRAVDEQGNVGRTVSVDTAAGGGAPPPGGNAARRCLPRRLKITPTRIGHVRLGARLTSVRRRYRVLRRGRRVTRLCVRGGGRFLVAGRRRRVSFIASTARGHRARGAAPAQRRRKGRPSGARRVRRGLFVGTRGAKGRVVYGVRRGRFNFVAVVRRADARRTGALSRRLRVLGLR